VKTRQVETRQGIGRGGCRLDLRTTIAEGRKTALNRNMAKFTLESS